MAKSSASDASLSTLVTGYRPWLDGVRAVAVLMVVVQHTMGQMPIDLGNSGVGVFFALSGYLITSLLLDGRAADGSVSLAAFYLRRAARLVPALVLVVVVCDALFIIAGDHGPLKGSLAALTYTANYAEILKSDFVLGFGPTWSLAVEEHFYLLWPLFLLWVTRRWGLRTALWSTLAVCVAALVWRAALAAMHAPVDLLALGSLERSDALLYGCAAAIAVRLGWRPRAWMMWAGIGLVAVVTVAFGGEANYPAVVIGTATLSVGAAAVIVCLDYAAAPCVRRLLSVRAVVAVGILSYGIYLWHGPAMRVAADFGHSGRAWRAVVAAVTVLVAGLSHRYLEVPVRARARRRADALARSGLPGGAPIAEIQERIMLKQPTAGVRPDLAPRLDEGR